jgi:hypothetical protein
MTIVMNRARKLMHLHVFFSAISENMLSKIQIRFTTMIIKI